MNKITQEKHGELENINIELLAKIENYEQGVNSHDEIICLN